MISKSCDFNEFLEKINGQEYPEILLAANDEATAAERIFHKRKSREKKRLVSYQQYAMVLKDFIYFLRNGIKPFSIREFDFQEFQTARENWMYFREEC